MPKFLRFLLAGLLISGVPCCGHPGSSEDVAVIGSLGQALRRQPVLKSVEPVSCASSGGCTITLTGDNLLSDTVVRFTNAGTGATDRATVLGTPSATQLMVTVPASGALGTATFLNVTVENAPDLTATRSETFIYYEDELDLLPVDTLRAPNQPCDAVSENFDADGKRDLLVAACGFSSKKLYLYLNQAGRTFKDPVAIPLFGNPLAIATARLDANPTADLLVLTDAPGQELVIFLGDGTGRFSSVNPLTGRPNTYSLGRAGRSMSVADFNGDGRPDVAVDTGYGIITVFTGTGTGTLSKLQNLYSSSWLTLGWDRERTLIPADINDDGTVDLVSTGRTMSSGSTGGVDVYINAKSETTPSFGTGKPTASYYTGIDVAAVFAENVVGDSKPDLVIADGKNSQIYVLRNTGGAFPALPPAAIPTIGRGNILSLALIDGNGDAVPDVVASTANGLELFSANGAGFDPGTVLDLGLTAPVLRTMPIDSDLYRDLVMLTSSGPAFGSRSDLVTLVFGNRDGLLPVGRIALQNGGVGKSQVSALLTIPESTPYLFAADAGSFVDLGHSFSTVTGGLRQGLVSIALGVYPAALANLNYNGDSNIDIVSADYVSNTFTLVKGAGRGRLFTESNVALKKVTSPWVVAASDHVKDGVQSAIAIGGENGFVDLWTTDLATKALSYKRSINMSVRALAFADVYNDDGKPDLIVAKADSDEVWLLPYNDMNVFNEAMPVKLPVQGKSPMALLTQDFDGDGKADLLVVVHREPAPGNPRSVAVFVKRMGVFEYRDNLSFSSCNLPDVALFANVGGDAAPDLVLGCDGEKTLRVYYNLGRGAFGAAAQVLPRPAPGPIAALDVDGDLRKELVLGQEMAGTLTVLRNGRKLR